MYHKCCVPGCVSFRKDVRLHKFPKCQKRLQMWLDGINSDSLRNISANDLCSFQVCHKHFEARFVTKKSRLLSIAYPSLFLPSEIISGIPTNPNKITESLDPIVDHRYSKKRHVDHSYCKQQESHTQKDTDVPALLSNTFNEDEVDNIQESCAMSQSTPEEMPIYSYLPSFAVDTYIDNQVGNVQQSLEYEAEDTLQCPAVTPADISENLTINTSLPNIIEDNSTFTEYQTEDSLHSPGSIMEEKSLRNVKSLTSKYKILYHKYRKSQKLLWFTRRAKKALKFKKLHYLEEITADMNPLAKKMLLMQLKLCSKREKARRFTLEEKLICLSILKQGLKSYRFLQNIFILPSEKTLKKLELYINSSINTEVFNDNTHKYNANGQPVSTTLKNTAKLHLSFCNDFNVLDQYHKDTTKRENTNLMYIWLL